MMRKTPKIGFNLGALKIGGGGELKTEHNNQDAQGQGKVADDPDKKDIPDSGGNAGFGTFGKMANMKSDTNVIRNEVTTTTTQDLDDEEDEIKVETNPDIAR